MADPAQRGDGSRTMRVRLLVEEDPHSGTRAEWRYLVHLASSLEETREVKRTSPSGPISSSVMTETGSWL